MGADLCVRPCAFPIKCTIGLPFQIGVVKSRFVKPRVKIPKVSNPLSDKPEFEGPFETDAVQGPVGERTMLVGESMPRLLLYQSVSYSEIWSR